MKEAYAVTGYLTAEDAARLTERRKGVVELFPERDMAHVSMRVSAEEIAEVRVGATRKDQTLVQLILKRGATVETVIRSSASARGLSLLSDPTLQQLTAAATAKSIVV